jgi:hypothetical protein
MSTSHEIVLECPHCGHSQKSTLWGSINVTIHPHLKDDFFKGRLNIFDCEKCKMQTPIICGFMYNDMTKKILVQYQPPQEMKDDEFLNLFASNGSVILPEELAKIPEVQEYMSQPHVVFDMEELRRYVRFRELLYERRGRADGDSGETGVGDESPN